jgi:hypothetical protein
MSTTITTTIPKLTRSKRQHAASKRRAQPYSTNSQPATRAKKNRRKRRGNNSARSSNSMKSAMYSGYISTLADPWRVGGVRIGFGTMVSTNLYTAYLRTILTTSSDGSLSVVISPQIINMLYYCNSGITSTTWAGVNATNYTYIQNAAYEGRIVSGGIRCVPQIPATSAPGVAYAGTFPAFTPTNLIANSCTTLISAPIMKMGFGAPGASAVILPVDPSSFQFLVATISGYANGTNFATSSGVVCFTGLGNATNVMVELALNIECIQNAQDAGSFSTPGDDTINQPTLADSFPSLDSLWSSARRNLPESTSIAEGFARAAHVVHGGIKLYNTVKNARSNMYNAPSGAGRVTIEEIS